MERAESPGGVKKKLTEAECFAHRLCLAMGEPDVDVVLARLTYRKYLDWQAYFAQEPWGELRADMRSMVLAAHILSPHMPSGTELPNPTYPYFEDTSPEAVADKAQELKRWIAENRERLHGNHNRQNGGRSDERHHAV